MLLHDSRYGEHQIRSLPLAVLTKRYVTPADIFLRYGPVACFLQVNWVTPVKIRSLAVTGTVP